MCVLLRLNHMEGAELPQVLKDVLANGDILKVGVGIHNDVSKLWKDHRIMVYGCLDLRYLVNIFEEMKHITGRGLKDLARDVLGEDLDKSPKIRCSNWEADVLKIEQIQYAARDAIVAGHIFAFILDWKLSNGLLLSIFRPPFRAKHHEIMLLCKEIMDVPFKSSGVLQQCKVPHAAVPSPFHRKDPIKAYSTRKKPLYENCILQAPDGEPLCTCDTKKAQWYIDRHLGEMVSEKPFIVQLKFEPKGRPILDNQYYTQPKENICVVCGKAATYIRKNVVPHEYRKFFPSILKDHVSHDILLLCVACHHHSNWADFVLRQQLAVECDAPIEAKDIVRVREDPQLRKIRSAARAILKSGDLLPEARNCELQQVIQDHYGSQLVTEEMLNEAALMDISIVNKDYVPHGLKVVKYASEHGGLIAFESRWRQHFLETMKPQFLPALWSVNHNHDRLALKLATTTASQEFDVAVLGFTDQQLQDIVQKYA